MNVDGMTVRTMLELGSRLRARRHAIGRTQAEVAAAVGVSRTWLSLVENGRSPGAEVGLVLALVAVLDLDVVIGARAGAEIGTGGEGDDLDLDAIVDAHRGS